MSIDLTALGQSTVLDLDGQSVRVDTFYEEGPAVLVFLRHYG